MLPSRDVAALQLALTRSVFSVPFVVVAIASNPFRAVGKVANSLFRGQSFSAKMICGAPRILRNESLRVPSPLDGVDRAQRVGWRWLVHSPLHADVRLLFARFDPDDWRWRGLWLLVQYRPCRR